MIEKNKNVGTNIPTLSVIVPIYNVEKYLKKCIDSVLSQDFSDLEVILVNDGSTDDSGVICDDFATMDHRVRVIHRINGGLSEARNTGIRMSKGKYLMFLDSDDWWNENVSLSKLLNSVRELPNVDLFIYDSIDYLDGDGVYFKRRRAEPNYKKIYSVTDLYEYFSTTGEFQEAAFTKVIKRKTLVKNDLFFKVDILNEDIHWMMRLLRVVNSCCFLNASLVIYRLGRPGSISNNLKPKNLIDMLSIIEESVDFYKTAPASVEIAIKRYELDQCAKIWFIVLGLVGELENKDRDSLFDALKKLSFITESCLSSKTKIVRFIYRLFGLKLTSLMLNYYYNKFRLLVNRKNINNV